MRSSSFQEDLRAHDCEDTIEYLLSNRGLAALAGAEQEELVRPRELLRVLLELLLNLLRLVVGRARLARAAAAATAERRKTVTHLYIKRQKRKGIDTKTGRETGQAGQR